MFVEKPPHVDDASMRHISDEALLEAFGVSSVQETRHWRRPRPLVEVNGGEVQLGVEVDFLDKGHGRSRLYGFHYLRWMAPLTEAYERTGDPVYAKEWDRLFSQWYTTRDQVEGDWPGLDVIWYSLGVWARSKYVTHALAAFADEPALSDACWMRMMKTVLGGARWAAEEHDSFRNGNWQFACVSELLHVATLFPELDEAPAWRELAMERLLEHLELDVRADGGHHERSPGYHSMCLEAVQRAARLDASLAAHPRVRAMHDWFASLQTQGGWIPHLQDSGVVWPGEQLRRGYELLGMEPDPITGSHLLDPSGYAIFQNADFHTVINYGPYVGHELEPHSHHAVLDFVFSGWGLPLAWEAGGPPSYDDPGYYTWYQATRGHNTVLVPGREFAQDRQAECDLFATGEHVDVFAGHHFGYGTRHDRRIVFVRTDPSYWLVTDEIDTEMGTEAVWQIHGLAPWREHGIGYVSSHLYVVPLTEAAPEYGSGPARIPDPTTMTAEYGEIHSLGLRRTDGRFAVAVFPFLEEPPDVRVLDGSITVDGVTDRFTADGWTRDGLLTERWGGDE